MTNICILKYNNYFNRKVLYPTGYEPSDDMPITAYTSTTLQHWEYTNMNFYKGDGVNATLVINGEHTCDYLLEYATIGENQTKVLTRWFIIEQKNVRGGQYEYKLKRDVLVDFYDSYKDAPVYIEKATIKNPTDVAIYNTEDIDFNSIKTSETLLKDNGKSKNPWIVGYYEDTATVTDLLIPDASLNTVGTYATTSAFYNAIGYNGTEWRLTNNYELLVKYNILPDSSQLRAAYSSIFAGTVDYHNVSDLVWKLSQLTSPYTIESRKEMAEIVTSFLFRSKDLIFEKVREYDTKMHNDTPMVYNDKYVIIGNDYYQITVNQTAVSNYTRNFRYDSSLGIYIKGLLETEYPGLPSSIYEFYEDPTETSKEILKETYDYTSYTFTLTKISLSGMKVSIPATSNKLSDAPYKMFAIPAGKLVVWKNVGSDHFQTPTMEQAIAIGTRLATEMSSKCYDVQLLPYCPCQEFLDINGDVWTGGDPTVTQNDYAYIYDSVDPSIERGIILFPKKASFTLDINKSLTLPESIEDKKVVNQCDNYRLCSPNYSSLFDFNLVKTGSITKFNVDCTYKPFNPYIHINPNWSNLYGQDYNDIRGLILQGDFSLPVMSNKWTEYQINNKNYLNAFNREVDSVELQNKLANKSEGWNVAAGAVTAGASGAGMGLMMGGGAIGAVASGLVSAGASALAGNEDIKMNKRLRAESLDLKKDQFNYSLQNIQALPNTIAKVSSYDYNNKIFPVLEYYTCTEQEKEIFKDKMKYNGMKVMRIDKISNFLVPNEYNYIKGQVIQLPDLADDYHVATDIASEIFEGGWM